MKHILEWDSSRANSLPYWVFLGQSLVDWNCLHKVLLIFNLDLECKHSFAAIVKEILFLKTFKYIVIFKTSKHSCFRKLDTGKMLTIDIAAQPASTWVWLVLLGLWSGFISMLTSRGIPHRSWKAWLQEFCVAQWCLGHVWARGTINTKSSHSVV